MTISDDQDVPPVAQVQTWNVSYNNGEPFTVEAFTERQAISLGIDCLGIDPVHPIRAWPIKELS